MAMSSKIHQIYTRKWSREWNVPVFSIDYRLAPEYSYPAAIDDVWQAYVWIVKYSLDFLGITTDKIVLAGDSAGGALAVSKKINISVRRFYVSLVYLFIYNILFSNNNAGNSKRIQNSW